MFGLSEEFFLNRIEVNLENDKREIEDKENEEETMIQFWNPHGMKREEKDHDDNNKKSQSSSSWKCRLWDPSKLSFHCMEFQYEWELSSF